MDATVEVPLDREGSLILALLLSILVHALFALFVIVTSLRTAGSASSPFSVELLEPEEAPKRYAAVPPPQNPATAPQPPEPAVERPQNQIVAPPDSPEEKSEQARLFSDRDSKALEEMVKRGEPAPPAKPPDAVAKEEKKKAPGPDRAEHKARGAAEGEKRGADAQLAARDKARPSERAAPLPGLSDLFVKPSELAKDSALRKGSSGDAADAEDASGRTSAAIRRPELWADPGQRGTPDYLPDVRQGNFTLLNTKADRFAPFVRRVGLRVFQTFSMDFKQMIFAGQVPQGRENIEVEAIMSRDGKRIEVFLKGRNGNLSTDRVLLGTLRDQIFFDDNPPPNAVAEDGRIHFVFALDARVWYAHDDRGTVQPGAQWIFGAGLL